MLTISLLTVKNTRHVSFFSLGRGLIDFEQRREGNILFTNDLHQVHSNAYVGYGCYETALYRV